MALHLKYSPIEFIVEDPLGKEIYSDIIETEETDLFNLTSQQLKQH